MFLVSKQAFWLFFFQNQINEVLELAKDELEQAKEEEISTSLFLLQYQQKLKNEAE